MPTDVSWSAVWKIVSGVLVSLGGGTAIVFAFSSWLGKVWASRILAKEKHDLDILLQKHQIKFSNLQAKQAEVIEQIYALLISYRRSLLEIAEKISMSQYPAEHYAAGVLWEKSINLHLELNRLSIDKAIFLPNEVEPLLDTVLDFGHQASVLSSISSSDGQKNEVPQLLNNLLKAITTVVFELKVHFKSLLGTQD